jgi:MFS family permease
MQEHVFHTLDTSVAHDDSLREARLLIAHRTLIRMALAALSAFSVIFLYEYFDHSFLVPITIAGAVAFLTALLTPLTARGIGSLGIRRMLIASVPLFALGMCGLYVLSDPTVFSLSSAVGIGTYIVATSLYRALYWVPYHIDLSHALSGDRRGRELAELTNASDIVVVAMPLLAGLLITVDNYNTLFLFGIGIILVSVVPLLRLHERYESFSWGFTETFREMRLPHIRPMVAGHFADGIQSSMLLVVWPLAIFILLKGDYKLVGAVASLTLIAVLFIRSLTGWLFDRWSKHRLLFWSALLSASGWILKVFVWTPLQVFGANIYHEIGSTISRTSIDAMSYEQAADNGRFVDEYTVVKEIALNAGRVLGLALVGIVAVLFGVAAGVFVGIGCAAISALVTAWIARRVRIA